MHVELVAPALLAGDEPAPAAELVLARGRRTASAPLSQEAWLAQAFGLREAGGDALPAGALSALAGGLEPGAGAWLRADPVHLRADRDCVRLLPADGFELPMADAEALAAALNAHFAADFSLHPLRPAAWCLQPRREMQVQGRAPRELAGRDIDAELPDKRLHPLLNEIQMALYQHPVNTARDARGEPVVNGLWLWGAGTLPAADALHHVRWHSLSADDLVALGLARLAGLRHRDPGAGATGWLERAPDEGRHLVILDAARGAPQVEEAWIAPLLAALRSGRIGMLTLHLPEAGLAVETVRGDLKRFWRRVRPLAAYAAPRQASPAGPGARA
jgi:hypothetical protein